MSFYGIYRCWNRVNNLRIRKKPWAEPELAVCPFFIKEPENLRGKWNTRFKLTQPLYLEVGCGKGGFVGQTALNKPDINFLAVDIKSDMLGVARRNIVKLFEEENKQIGNILLTAYNVDQIDKILAPEDKIGRIYINFCNPWPRAKHKKRRLTFPRKLKMYREFLVDGGEIHFKTDNDELFLESLEYFEECGFNLIYKTMDLHSSGYEDNVETEHEKMFSEQGINIKFCIVKKVQ